MIISPIRAISEGWITHPECSTIDDWKAREFISPNAIDFDITQCRMLDDQGVFIITNTLKQHVASVKMRPISNPSLLSPLATESTTPGDASEPGFFGILGHECVDFMSSMYANIPAGVCAWLIVRSSLNRNGLFITSGLYDQGFSGPVAGMLHNRRPREAFIQHGTRIGQIVFSTSDDSNIMYAGGYNTAVGQHWTTKETSYG